MKEKKLFFMDLFAGCGGLSLGLEKAGFTPVYVNELHKDAMETYLVNRLEKYPLLEKYKSNDIKELLSSDISKLIKDIKKDNRIRAIKHPIDLIAGGPPCQGYSNIGHRRSYGVDKEKLITNHLYKGMAEVIKKVQPKAFLFENVKGLLSSRWTKDGEKGEIWEDVLSTFKNETGNYNVQFKILNAYNFGVPQNRPRIFIIGVHKDINTNEDFNFFPEPLKTKAPDLIDVLGDLIDKNYKKELKSTTYLMSPNKIQKEFRNGNKSKISDHEYSNHSKKVEERFKLMIQNKKNMKDLPKKYRTKKFSQKLLPSKWGGNPSITVTSLPDDYIHFSQPRTLTVREWARLQTFPDSYIFKGLRTTGGLRRAGNPKQNNFDRDLPKYTQIGNAVPVNLAEQIGKKIYNLLS